MLVYRVIWWVTHGSRVHQSHPHSLMSHHSASYLVYICLSHSETAPLHILHNYNYTQIIIWLHGLKTVAIFYKCFRFISTKFIILSVIWRKISIYSKYGIWGRRSSKHWHTLKKNVSPPPPPTVNTHTHTQPSSHCFLLMFSLSGICTDKVLPLQLPWRFPGEIDSGSIAQWQSTSSDPSK